jgi:catechol 2,3-dioxygenase-like lactoylglutathione lyase family enzyme
VTPMIGRLHHVILDCPDPAGLAAFYSELVGLPVTYTSDDFVVIAANDETSGLAFQLAVDHQPPQWPDPNRPQQAHLDVMVDDLATADLRVVELGARRLDSGDDVYADPAGHPFCLVRRPSWAPPIGAVTASVAAMTVAVHTWVDGYRRAWESNDPEQIRALFTEDATYETTPHDPDAWHGIDAIVEEWLRIRDEPGTTTFEWEIAGIFGDVAFVRGVSVYADDTYDNLWVIRLVPDGQAREFTEWYVARR